MHISALCRITQQNGHHLLVFSTHKNTQDRLDKSRFALAAARLKSNRLINAKISAMILDKTLY